MDAEDADVEAVEIGRLPAQSVEAVGSDAVESGAADEESGMTVPELEPTGNADVDTALDRLRELGERQTGAHPDVYDGVHQRLQEVLAQIDHQDAGR